MEYKFIHSERIHSVKLDKKDDSYQIVIDDITYEVVDVVSYPNIISFNLNGKLLNVYFAEDKDKKYLSIDGENFILELEKGKSVSTYRETDLQQKGNSVASPMPGLLVKVPVAVGDKVSAGTTLAIVEAMKMQNELVAPCDGVVKKVNFKEGDQVDAQQLIVELEI